MGDDVVGVFSKEQGNAPDSCEGDYCIDNSREHGGGASANPRDDVKLEKSDASPVECADDG